MYFVFTPLSDNLEILDPFSSAIRVYDKDGVFIKNISLSSDLLPMGRFTPLSSDLYIFESSDIYPLESGGYKEDKTSVKVFSVSKKEIIDRIIPLPENANDLTFTNRMTFIKLGDDMLFCHKFPNNDVFQIDTFAKLTEHYIYDFGKYTFNVESLPKNQDRSFYKQYDRNNKKDYVFPYTKPENHKYRFCYFGFDDELYISRQNKESMHIEVANQKFKNGGWLIPPVYIDDNYLYNKAEPIELEYMLSKEILTEEQQEIISQIKEDDNPIIVRYKIK